MPSSLDERRFDDEEPSELGLSEELGLSDDSSDDSSELGLSVELGLSDDSSDDCSDELGDSLDVWD